jgi:hypothetical protein
MHIDNLINEYKELSTKTKAAEKAARKLREEADVYKKGIIELCKDTGFVMTETQKAEVLEINVAGFTVAPRVRYDVKISTLDMSVKVEKE